MFGDASNEEEKGSLVDDLVDVKLLPATDVEGVHFTKDRIDHR